LHRAKRISKNFCLEQLFNLRIRSLKVDQKESDIKILRNKTKSMYLKTRPFSLYRFHTDSSCLAIFWMNFDFWLNLISKTFCKNSTWIRMSFPLWCPRHELRACRLRSCDTWSTPCQTSPANISLLNSILPIQDLKTFIGIADVTMNKGGVCIVYPTAEAAW
jgi:hypothetical protein